MNEVKRVLRNKKFVTFLIVMILLNCGLFAKNQYDTLRENDLIANFSDVEESYTTAVKRMKKLKPSKALERISNEVDTYDGEWNSYIYSIQILKQKLEYLVSYSSFLEQIKKNQEIYTSTSIFSDETSFSYKNIEKTVDDFSDMSEEQIGVGNYLGVEAFFSFSFTDYAVIVIMLGICVQLLGGRKQSLERIVHSSYNGRAHLAIKRVGILFSCSVFFVSILYISNLLIAIYLYGGMDDLHSSIQSLEAFMRVSDPINILQFILVYLVLKCLGAFFISLVIYLILTVVNDATAGFIGIGTITILEYVLYSRINMQSNFVFFKYINIFSIINQSETSGIYLNINIFWEPIHVQLLLWSIVLFATILLIPSIVMVSVKKYPCESSSIITRLIRQIENAFFYITTKFHLLGFEVMKHLFFQGGLLITCILVILLYESRPSQNDKYYDSMNTYLNQFYVDNSGNGTKDAQKYIREIKQQISLIDNEQQNLEAQYKSGEITYSEYYNKQSAYRTIEAKESAINVFAERVDALMQYEEETGVPCSIVNPNGYNKLFGEDSFATHQEFACKAILFEVLFLYMLFVYEKQTKASYLIRATVRGRDAFLIRKLLQIIMVSAGIVLVFTYMEIYNIKIVYGLPSTNAAIGSIECMQFIKWDISIQMFIGILCIIRFCILICIGLVILMISILTQKREQTLLATMVVLLMPVILFSIGIKGCKYCSFVLPLSVLELIYNSDMLSVKIVSAYALCAVVGGISFIITRKKWV